jgi:hypothetical protein
MPLTTLSGRDESLAEAAALAAERHLEQRSAAHLEGRRPLLVVDNLELVKGRP